MAREPHSRRRLCPASAGAQPERVAATSSLPHDVYRKYRKFQGPEKQRVFALGAALGPISR
jgi:hypothetical protein